MKRKSILTIILLAIMMVISSCGGSKTRKVNTKEEAKQLVEEFFEGIKEQDNYIVTISSGDKTSSKVIVDGDKVKMDYTDPTYPDWYMFIEDGKKYSLYEGGQPYEDESGYDANYNYILNGFRFYTDIILGDDNEGEKYEAELTTGEENGEISKQLKITVKTNSDAGEITSTITGKAVGDKMMSYSREDVVGDSKGSSQATYEYGDGILVELPEYEIKAPREYTHVDSPYATLDEVVKAIGMDKFHMTIVDDRFYVIADMLQLSGMISAEQFERYDKLNGSEDVPSEELNNLLNELRVDDCIDFSEYVMNEEDFAQYTGLSVADLVNEGFEGNGWSIYEDVALIWAEKEGMVYEADIDLPEGFDVDKLEDFSDLYEATIKKMRFSELSWAMIPLQ